MRRVAVLVTGFLLLASGSSFAQDVPKIEVGGGYHFLAVKLDTDAEWTNFWNGWYGEVAANLTPMIGVFGQVTGNYKTEHEDDADIDISGYNYMGGVRFNARKNPRVTPFGQFLFGASTVSLKAPDFDFDESETNMVFGFGGGFVVGTPVVGIRGGVDYIRPFIGDDGPVFEGVDANYWRWYVGVNFGIGK